MSDATEYKRLLKSLHICPNCKRQDAYTLSGRRYCAECAAKDAERKRKWRAEHAQENRAGVHQVEQKRAEAGLCIRCGKRKPATGNKVCCMCNLKRSRKRREKQVQQGMNWPRGANGYCWRCNKRPAMDGKRLCVECYAANIRQLAKVNEKRKGCDGV